MKQNLAHNRHTRGLSLVCLSLIFGEGILALLWIFSQPGDPDWVSLLGYSPVRWALAGVIFLLTGLSGALWLDLARSIHRPWRENMVSRPVFPAVVAVLSLGLVAADHETFLLLAAVDHYLVKAILARLLPVALFLGLAGLQILLAAAPAVRGQARPDEPTLRAAGLSWIGLVLAAGLVLLTRIGLYPVTNGWYDYGVPLIHEQVLGLAYGAILVLLVGLAAGKKLPFLKRTAIAGEAGLILALWLAAIILWSSMPVPDSWFSPRPYPPNYEAYPNSDALSYDTAAQGTLLGAAWARNEVHYKPLYVAFLTLLHAAAGQDYARVIWLQTLLLALFPVSLYVLGRSLHSRLAGGLAGLAAILREYNQLTVASLTTLSNSKLMLSELPTALGISVLLIVLAIWLKAPGQRNLLKRPYLALLAGGIIGLLIEIRLQAVLFLPALAALLFIIIVWPAGAVRGKAAIPGKGWRTWLAATGLVCLGFGLSTAPLALRNGSISGTLALEKPGYFERTLAYAYNPVAAGTALRDPVPSGLSMGGSGLAQTIEVAAHHFIHNTASALLVLPSGFGSGSSWTMGFELPRLFWLDSQAAIRLPTAAWLIFNLGMVALGGAALWQRGGWASLMPALFFGIYNLSSALGGYSGQRFILPVDWIGYFYFMAGLAWLATMILGLLGWNVSERMPFWTQPLRLRTDSETHFGRVKRWRAAAAAGMLILAGGLLPLEEALIPVRYPGMDTAQAQAELVRLAERQLTEQEMSALRSLLARPDSEVWHGAALYPRAIENERAEADILRHTGDRTYPLLAYVYLGGEMAWVIQPLGRVDEAALPNAAEVIVAGKRAKGSFQAFATAQIESGQVLLSIPAGEK